MKYQTDDTGSQLNRLAIIGRFFGQLPPTQFRQALNLRNTITSLDGTQSGSWKDILTAENAQPWLLSHRWLLESQQLPAGLNRTKIENELHLAMFFSYLATWLNEAIMPPDTIFNQQYQSLAETLRNEASHHFQQLFPLDHAFWQDHLRLYQDYNQAISWQTDRQSGSETSFGPADWQQYANRLAPFKLGVTSAVHCLDIPEHLPTIWQMVNAANQAYLIQQDILALRRDLLRNHLSYPIMRTIALARIAVNRPFNPEQIMGAALLTGAVKKVCAEATDRLQASAQIATDLKISGWSSYCDQLQDSINGLQSLFSLKKGSPDEKQKQFFLPHRDIMGQSLRMAEGYLLADPNFQESYEVNRGGLEGLEEARGIIFPLSFITYLLLENGHDLGQNVDKIFSKMEQLGYRYYENMAVAPDTDEAGILLRLFKYSQNKEQHRQQLERPLQWLKANILPGGSIPAFWNTTDIDILERMVVWENYCLTAEINTLLGLIAFDWSRFQPLVEESALGVFGRYLTSDFGTVAYYDLRYTLWQTLTLLRELQSKTTNSHLTNLIDQAHIKLTERLILEVGRGAETPQQAAFLIMACLDGRHGAHLDPTWITFLQKTQRYDGSWDNEPFFITCDRDGLPGNWYSSRTMTTAFCYHALNQYNLRR